jgi:hypothetical protein
MIPFEVAEYPDTPDSLEPYRRDSGFARIAFAASGGRDLVRRI